MPFASVNPFTSEHILSYPSLTSQEIENSLSISNKIISEWKAKSFSERASCFIKLSELLNENADKLAKIASEEMGKIHREAKAEILKSANACIYYAENAERILAPIQAINDSQLKVNYYYQPMGCVLGIFPWNFPYWQILRCLIPVVMSGNVMLIKPAPNVPACSLALQELLNQSGLENVTQTIFVETENIVALIRDERIHGVSLTGSEKAGASVAAIAGSAIKPIVLELGGSDPFIVCADADIDSCVETLVLSRFQNNGQSCIAAKRCIIDASIYEVFIEKLIQKLRQLKIGNPMDSSVDIGPLARLDLHEKLHQQVSNSVSLGAKIIYQSSHKNSQGCFYPPTLLTNIQKHMPAFSEELFGPVLSVFTFQNMSEAIELANATNFGLGASIWTRNNRYANEIALKLDCGQVFINRLVRSDVRCSFGGAKRSGLGYELGEEGLKSFCTKKAVWENS